jgi:hypothetical protein
LLLSGTSLTSAASAVNINKLMGLGMGSYKIEIYGYDATTTSRLLTVSDGYYESGVTGNFSSTETSATAVAVS